MIMSSYFLNLFYALLLLLLFHSAGSILAFNWPSTSGDVKCIERERQALLNFKQGLRDDSGMLSTWKDDEHNGDCCKWKGIECHNETGHVLELDLHGSDWDTHYLIGALNITPLVELQNMEYLDLSWNAFRGSHIPELFGSFTKLRHLNLSNSGFGGRIPYQLGNISQLQYLDLKVNSLVGAIPSQLGNISQLQYLDLKYTSLAGAIPSQLGKLTLLRYLYLNGNYLGGEIPHQLGNLRQLRYLDLGGNYLSGAIPFQIGNLPMLQSLRLDYNSDLKLNDSEWLSNLSSLTNLGLSSLHNLGSSQLWLQMISKHIPNLRELRLSGCSLSDNNFLSFFDSRSNFSTSLTILDLSDNMLTSSTFQLLFNFSFNNLQELYLSSNNFVLSFPPYPYFPSLVILDLSYNNLTSSIFQGNFNFGPKLQKLYLRNCSLLDNSFRVPSASTMNSSSSLVFLDLSNNLLTSSAVFHRLFNFTTNLHTLYLYGNLLGGLIPNGFGKVMNSLEYLDLSINKLQGEIPAFFGNMCTLHALDLSNNKLQGEIPASFGNMCTLQTLYLSNNNLSGEISNFIQNSSWCNRHIFQDLDLSYNRITGMLPKSVGLLSELNNLYLEGNSLEGDITESHLTNFSKLKGLGLSHNSLSLKFVSSWVPPFQLRDLDLASCKLGPSFPSWLQTQSYLSDLDISDAGIIDSVPEWFWNKLQYIGTVNMSHNNLTGAIPNLSLKLTNRPSIILNSNQFEGGVPSFWLQASDLILSENKFSDLFSFLCDNSSTANLATLDLSNNQIKGQLPGCWESVNSLLFLDLSNNNLSGKIPLSIGKLVKLEALVLRNNSLIGELPSTLKSCTNLIMLDVGENLLSGPIPSWIGESLQQLMILSLRKNNFSGILPLHLCYLRQIHLLDLSRNNLSKGIPTCLTNFTAMAEKSINISETADHIYWYNRTYYAIYGSWGGYFKLYISLVWKGTERMFRDPEFLLKSIDLSSNHLTGEIPTELVQLLGLVSLNLSRNNLSGEIPSQIGNLNSLEFLDLSKNHFSGRIPSTLSQIDRLTKLDLSNNSLYGKIPWGRQLQTFDSSSFDGNLDLCGEQLDKICSEDETPVKPQGPIVHENDENSLFLEALYLSLGLGYFTGFWGFLGPILLWRPWRNVYVMFLNKLVDYIYVMVAVNKAKCQRWIKG